MIDVKEGIFVWEVRHLVWENSVTATEKMGKKLATILVEFNTI